MKLTEEIEEFINLTITEHMGKEYAEWKIKQQSVAEPDKVEEEYEKVIASLSPEQEEAITKYCDAIFSSGADTEEFFYRLGLKDGLKLRKVIKVILNNLASVGKKFHAALAAIVVDASFLIFSKSSDILCFPVCD